MHTSGASVLAPLVCERGWSAKIAPRGLADASATRRDFRVHGARMTRSCSAIIEGLGARGMSAKRCLDQALFEDGWAFVVRSGIADGWGRGHWAGVSRLPVRGDLRRGGAGYAAAVAIERERPVQTFSRALRREHGDVISTVPKRAKAWVRSCPRALRRLFEAERKSLLRWPSRFLPGADMGCPIALCRCRRRIRSGFAGKDLGHPRPGRNHRQQAYFPARRGGLLARAWPLK